MEELRPPPASETRTAHAWPVWLAAALLLAAGVWAYANAFKGEFFFDDHGAIVGNPRLAHLWPLSDAFWAPPRTTTIARPAACFSLALNHAFCGLSVWGYRLGNLAIHLLAALTLFGLLRRTFQTEALRPRWGAAATGLAFAAALLWVLHPLNGMLVNYIVQRTESLMALFYLLTLYLAVRGWQSRERVLLWHGGAVAACVLGMCSKEVMLSAPLLVLLHDRTFVSGSFMRSLRRSKFLYAGLALSWLVLGALLSTGAIAEGAKHGREAAGAWQYLLTESGVLLYYLRLAAWPEPLCFDYGWPLAHGLAEVWPAMLFWAGMLGLAFRGARRRTGWSVPALLFFAVLAPSSSLLPLPDPAVEYRMYLPLAALSVLCVCAVWLFLSRFGARQARFLGLTLLACVALAFGLLTHARNLSYHSAESVWRDVTRKAPQNSRGFANLGVALLEKGHAGEAVQALQQAWNLNPGTERLHQNLGSALALQGRLREALPHFEAALRQTPDDPNACFNLANALSDLNRKDEAAAAYRQALRLNPAFAGAYLNLGLDLSARGKWDEAATTFEALVRLAGASAQAHYLYGKALAEIGQAENAKRQFALALELNPAHRQARAALDKLQGQ